MLLPTASTIATAQENKPTEDPTYTETEVSTENTGQLTTPEEFSEDQLIDVITVVGTRLKGGDRSARVEVITNEDIESLGLSSVEDILRTIPQNFSSINSSNNNSQFTRLDTFLGAGALGISTANLRGLGSGNTLVLLNGRRMSGAAGQEGFFVNLRDIPASAIERVEVNLEGGSAVYGSDGIGGIINIVTKSGYSGGSVQVNVENSGNDADSQQLSGYFGHGWQSGSASVTMSATQQDPVNRHKAGFTRLDNSNYAESRPDLLGEQNTRYPLVSARDEFDNSFGPYDFGAPISSDGTNLTEDDYTDVTPETRLEHFELLPQRDGSSDEEDISLTFNFNQQLLDNLSINAEVLYTKAESRSNATTVNSSGIAVPASNAFNPFGREVYVIYNPATEIANGLINAPYQESETSQLRYALGAEWGFTENWKLNVDYVDSTSKSEGVHYAFDDSNSEDNELPNADRIAELMASSDPEEAINLFGDGTVQNPGISELFIETSDWEEESYLNSLTAYASGQLFNMPGGKVSIVTGFERRVDGIKDPGGSGLALTVGNEPERELLAGFAEILLPFVAGNNEYRWTKQLSLTAQVRYDRYSMEGARGGDFDEVNETVDPNLVDVEFSNLSPRLGLSWRINNNFKLRASWSESFKAPEYSDLFDVEAERYLSDFGVYDPLIDDFVFGAYENFGANPDLKPEIATNIDFGMTITPELWDGLMLEINYSDIDFKDRIASSFELNDVLTDQAFGSMPEFFIRDENGTLLEAINMPINISRETNRTLDMLVTWDSFFMGGSLTTTFNYMKVLEHETFPTEDSEAVNYVGYSIGQDRYRSRASLDWYGDAWGFSSTVNYTPSYIANEFEPEPGEPNIRVDDYTTVDLSVAYAGFENTRITFGARNLFDADFPYILMRSSEPYDTNRVDLAGRVIYLNMNYEF
jgi:iron complex outermembrane receptor protein